MQEYVITKQDFAKWCSIPVDELASIPGKKMDIHIHDEKKDVFLEAADMMADGCTKVGCTEMGNKILEHI